eukprot:6190713-Pleurochrysis_carterae.AAC.1
MNLKEAKAQYGLIVAGGQARKARHAEMVRLERVRTLPRFALRAAAEGGAHELGQNDPCGRCESIVRVTSVSTKQLARVCGGLCSCD